MLARSTPTSVNQGRPSLLAITETIAAAVVYGWFAVKYGTFHLTVAACIVPFLLLRTNESTALVLSWCYLPTLEDGKAIVSKRIFAGFLLLTYLLGVLTVLLFAFLLPIAFITDYGHQRPAHWLLDLVEILLFAPALTIAGVWLVKVVATTLTLIREPTRTIGHIPLNWWRFVACVDVAHPSELVPGAAARPEYWLFVPRYYIRLLPSGGTPLWAILLFVPPLVFIAIAASVYRWSVKGTFLLLSPLIWTIHDSGTRTPESISDSAWFGVARKYSAALLILFVTKAVYLGVGEDFAFLNPYFDFLKKADQHHTLQAFIALRSFPAWQLLLFANSLLTFIIWFLAVRMKSRGYSTRQKTALDLAFVARAVLAVVAAFALVLFSASLALTK